MDAAHGYTIGSPVESHGSNMVLTQNPAHMNPEHVVEQVSLHNGHHLPGQPVHTAASPGTPAAPLRHTGKVALIPALLHKTEPHYDHETGHFIPGEQHVEPLIPAHDVAHGHFPVHDVGHIDGHYAGAPVLNHAGVPVLNHPDIKVVDTHHVGNLGGRQIIGHSGGGMEQASHMMEDQHAINMDNGYHLGPMNFGPELHAPIYDHNDGHHDGHVPFVVHPHADYVPPPQKKKPNLIKVEFVPEETSIKAGKGSKKAGTVRVQFIPGDNANIQEAVARNTAVTTGSTRDANAQTSTKQETAASIPTNLLASKLKDRLEGQQTEVRVL